MATFIGLIMNSKCQQTLEEWRSREDLDIHMATDYIQSLFSNIQSLIESSDIVEIKKI